MPGKPAISPAGEPREFPGEVNARIISNLKSIEDIGLSPEVIQKSKKLFTILIQADSIKKKIATLIKILSKEEKPLNDAVFGEWDKAATELGKLVIKSDNLIVEYQQAYDKKASKGIDMYENAIRMLLTEMISSGIEIDVENSMTKIAQFVEAQVEEKKPTHIGHKFDIKDVQEYVDEVISKAEKEAAKKVGKKKKSVETTEESRRPLQEGFVDWLKGFARNVYQTLKNTFSKAEKLNRKIDTIVAGAKKEQVKEESKDYMRKYLNIKGM